MMLFLLGLQILSLTPQGQFTSSPQEMPSVPYLGLSDPIVSASLIFIAALGTDGFLGYVESSSVLDS
jgi:hypothetical protein